MKILFLFILMVILGCSNSNEQENFYTKIIYTTGIRDFQGNFIEQSKQENIIKEKVRIYVDEDQFPN